MNAGLRRISSFDPMTFILKVSAAVSSGRVAFPVLKAWLECGLCGLVSYCPAVPHQALFLLHQTKHFSDSS